MTQDEEDRLILKLLRTALTIMALWAGLWIAAGLMALVLT